MSDKILEALRTENLLNWKRKLDAGTLPSLEQLADIIERNSDRPMPSWLVGHLCHRLRHPDKKKKGRPPSKPDLIRITFAKILYQMHLAEFQTSQKSQSTDKNRALPPPHERAAKLVQRSLFPNMDWKAVLNLLSSQK